MAGTARGRVSAEVERTLRTIFKRCLQCPPTTPSCPACVPGEICSLVPQDCGQCAHMTCIKNPTPAPKTSNGPNVGAIAGGVVGGVAFIALVVFLVWFFWIKKRRAEQDAELEEEWENDEIASQKRGHQFGTVQDADSTRTRGSLATSILSRASNIIQIAYIPGVMNRNGSGTNSINSPVPPIPAAHRSQPPKSPLSNEGDALFFRPGDLRDSTWSGTSSQFGNRDTRYSSNRDTRYTMKSITPSLLRDSVASDGAWDNLTTHPMPATTVARAAPKVVSVKSSSASNSSPPTPPDESSPPNHKTVQILGETMTPGSSLRSKSGSQYGKAKQVTLGTKAKGRFPVRQASDASSSPTVSSQHAPNVSSPLVERDEVPAEDENDGTRERRSLIHNMDFATPPAVQTLESPFFDATDHPSAAIAAASSTRPNPYASMASKVGASTELSPKRNHKSVGGLSAVIEEATKRASRQPSDASPFADEFVSD